MSKDTIDKVVAAVRKGFTDDAALRLSDEGGGRSEVVEVIQTGIEVVDRYVIGCGGLPVGRIIELFSPSESQGKTSFGMSCVAGCQRENGIAIWAETEEALDRGRFKVFGADTERVVLLQPNSIEEWGQEMEVAVQAIPDDVGPNLAVWDSLAATPTKSEIEDGLTGDARVGDRARTLNRIFRTLGSLLAKKRTALLVINQAREKIGVMFGNPVTTPGGNALKFHASVRLQIYGGGGKVIKGSDGEICGKDFVVKAVKNKVSMPWREATVRLNFAEGYDSDWSTLWHAKEKSLVGDKTRDVAEARLKLGW